MKERPILFSGAMVRAILEGRKTQTRRVVKPQPPDECAPIRVEEFHPTVIDKHGDEQPGAPIFGAYDLDGQWGTRCPYGKPGDRLWVREATEEDSIGSASFARYRADGFTSRLAWWYSRKSCPSIHMPRFASRITLEIVAVRVERLNDISEVDARSEGIVDGGCLNCGNSEPCGCADPRPDARDSFIRLWESINGTGSWHANPWVWVVEFKRVQP